MRLIFLTDSELSNTISGILTKEGKMINACNVGFSEELETDVVRVSQFDKTEEIPLSSFVNQLSETFNRKINNFDVMEVGDFGEGFVFDVSA